MNIVPAAVRDKSFLAAIGSLGLAGIRQSCALFHRQAIHISTHQHRGPCPVLEHGNNTRLADTFRNCETGSAHQLRQLGSRRLFLKRQFGMRMQILV